MRGMEKGAGSCEVTWSLDYPQNSPSFLIFSLRLLI